MVGETPFHCHMKSIRMKARIELLEILAESDEDVKYGITAPIKDTFDDLRKMLREDV